MERWGRAEQIIGKVLGDFWNNQAKLITDPTKEMTGLPLERLITNALRNEGLLQDEFNA